MGGGYPPILLKKIGKKNVKGRGCLPIPQKNRYFGPKTLILGNGDDTKKDEFSEKLQRGAGVSFSIQKFLLHIFDP